MFKEWSRIGSKLKIEKKLLRVIQGSLWTQSLYGIRIAICLRQIQSVVHVLIGKAMVRVDQFTKNRKAARPSGLVSEEIKSTCEAGIGMIMDLVLDHGNMSYSSRTGA